MTRLFTSPLWRSGDFLKLWSGQTVSQLGTRVTMLALPLTAIVTLHASPVEVGVLTAMGASATLVFSLVAGVWTDRLRKRPLLLITNLGRAVLLFSIPLAAWLGWLQLAQLYVVSFAVAALTVFFRLAYRSYLPVLVPREQLVDANGKLAASASAGQVAGPGVGGVLVQALSAPTAILADAISYLFAGASLTAIHAPEPARESSPQQGMRREMAEGLRLVLGSPLLRSITASTATFNLFDSVLFAVYLLYMSRTLGLAAAAIGVVFGVAGVGGLVGALGVAPLTARIGLGRAVIAGIGLVTAGELLVAGAGGPAVIAVLVLIAAESVLELGDSLFSVNVASLQQASVPEAMLGRALAAQDLLIAVAGPVGAVLGGLLGQTVGLRPTVIVAGVGTLLSVPWVALSPVRRVRELPVTCARDRPGSIPPR